MRWTKGTAAGRLLGDGLRLTWHRAGGSTLQQPLPPLPRVPAVCGAVHTPPPGAGCGQEVPLRAGVPATPLVLLSLHLQATSSPLPSP